MYINQHIKYECSYCGYRGEPQRITTTESETLRCPQCGHTKVVAVHTSSPADDNIQYAWTAGDETVTEY